MNVLRAIKRGIKLGGFPDEFFELISKPDKVLMIKIPVRMDNGRLEVFEGFRVQHNNALGPYKGGIRFHEEVSLNDDIALATLMTLKNSLSGIPYGGAKGAVKVNPKMLSREELERLSRSYIRGIAGIIGEQVDIPAPDIGTNPQIMAWMVDEYSKLKGYNVPGALTAKPPELWGNPVRTYSTGFGCYITAGEAAKKYLDRLQGIRIAIQGFGKVGLWAAYWCAKSGAKIIAISDSRGTIYNSEGINIERAIKVKKETGKVTNYPDAVVIEDSKAPLYTNADVIMPCALENQITRENMHKIKAKIIVEGANGPKTYEAEQYLTSKSVTIVPDLLANSGGVIMSYLEWIENLQWYLWEEEETRSKLEKIMKNNFLKVYEKHEEMRMEKNVSMRDAALVLALERIFKVMKIRGWL